MSKQCRAVSTTTNLRCQKKRSHVRREVAPMHQNGQVVWPEPQGHTVTYRTFDEAQTFTAEFAQALRAEVAKEFGDDRFGQSMAEPADPEQQLIDWWMGKAADEVERTAPKAVEYSSTDLADIGHVLARTAGRRVSEEEAAELGVFFYLQGKLSRWAGAVGAGRRPSDDTIFDIGVYCRMAQRIRHAGGWPGTKMHINPQQTFGMENQ